MAVGHLWAARLPDASGLFNLKRNLCGAIDLALIDAAICTPSLVHAGNLIASLTNDDSETACDIGIPCNLLAALLTGPLDPGHADDADAAAVGNGRADVCGKRRFTDDRAADSSGTNLSSICTRNERGIVNSGWHCSR
jgi:hypothetical protein